MEQECMISGDSQSSVITRVSIQSLPLELLLAIFKLVYANSAVISSGFPSRFHNVYITPGGLPPADSTFSSPFFDRMDESFPSISPSDSSTSDDPLSQSIFPYALASVCTQWRDVMLGEPIFWTRPVFTVGAYQPLFQPTVESHFDLSCNLALDIKVVCREELSASQPSSEQADVMALLPYILQNLDRCNGISFYLNRSSSLPSLLRHLGSIVLNLDYVRLRCKVDDGSNMLPAPSGMENCNAFILPTKSLVVDGRNFQDFTKYPLMLSWLNRTFFLTDIVISGYSPSTSELQPLSLRDVLNVLRNARSLSHLTLQNLDLDLTERDTGPTFSYISLRKVSFKDLSGDLISAFFELVPDFVKETSIARCSLPSRRNIRSPDLTLEAISINENLYSFLGRWMGHILTFKDCPGFDDTLLQNLAQKGRNGQWTCPAMLSLNISGCRNFSALSLRKMLNARIQAAPKVEDYTIVVLNGVEPGAVHRCETVSVRAGPFLDAENYVWFTVKIPKFMWRN